MRNILLIGGPGSGKGTLAKYISNLEWYNAQHISTGELFRFHMSNNTEIGLEVKEIINAGGLAKDDITVRMMDDAIRSLTNENGLIFDGFPRTLSQGPLLDELLKSYGFSLDLVIYLNTTDDVLLERLKGRSLVEDRPEDSDIEYCKKRISVFREQTTPLVDFYQKRGILEIIDASRSIDEVNTEMVKILYNSIKL